MTQGGHGAQTAVDQEFEARTVKTVFLRLMPLLLACYLLAYLDRINIGFAAITMNRDLGLDPYHYGLGAGLFFWGYFFFEVPGNLARTPPIPSLAWSSSGPQMIN